MLPQKIIERLEKGETHVDIMAEMDKQLNLRQKNARAIFA